MTPRLLPACSQGMADAGYRPAHPPHARSLHEPQPWTIVGCASFSLPTRAMSGVTDMISL
eukprot:721123-Prymnesium_polylepis.2